MSDCTAEINKDCSACIYDAPKFISSVGYSDDEILRSILTLHIKEIELDATFSIGKFYSQGIPQPKYCYDIEPKTNIVVKADCKNLPHESNSIKSIVFDPPFMFGNHGQQKNYSATKRYTMFKSYEELVAMYNGALIEFKRILCKGGILIFKCQDFTDNLTTMTHCVVYNLAIENNFYAKDIFVLINKFKILNTTLKQRHSRKFHSYFWIFQKR